MTSNAGRGHRAGFSQVEILVVVFIIGLMASVVTLTLPDDRSGLDDEVDSLAASLRMLAQESVLTGRTLGVVLTGEGYAFRQHRGGQWLPLEPSRFFAQRRWQEGTVLEAVQGPAVERRGSGRRSGRDGARDDGEAVPRIRFEPIGLATAFEIVLARSEPGAEQTYVVSGDQTGTITVGRDSPDWR